MYTVYKIINVLNEKYYIGVHKTTNPNDSYMGSGVAIKNAIKKYGKKNFKKEVILITEDKNEAYELEKKLTTDFNTDKTYNMKMGGVGGWSLEASRKGILMHNPENSSIGGRKSYEMKVGIHALNSDEKKKAGRLGGLANKGKPKSEEQKAKISATLREKKKKSLSTMGVQSTDNR